MAITRRCLHKFTLSLWERAARSARVKCTKPQRGVQYFVSGAAGKVRRGDVNRGSGLSAASFDDDNHFMVFEIGDNEASFQAISETGLVVDKGLVKQANS